MINRLNLVWKGGTADGEGVAGSACELFHALGGEERKLKLYGEPLNRQSLLKRIRRSHPRIYFLESEEMSFRFGINRVNDFDVLLIETKDRVCSSESILNAFMECGRFVYGWVVDRDYNFWQGATDPLEFSVGGRSCEGLPMKVSDFDDRKLVDTSMNPGREDTKNGYIEAVGGVMWFADEFFEVTGASLTKLQQLPYLQFEEKDDVLQVVLDEDLLADAEGDEEMAKKQVELRGVLFPQSANESMT